MNQRSNTISELQSRLSRTLHNEGKVSILLELSEALIRSAPELSREYAEKAYVIAEKLHGKSLIARSLYQLGVVELALRNYDAALSHLGSAAQMFLELCDSLMYAKTSLHTAALYTDFGRIDEALTLLMQNLERFEKLNEPKWIVRTITEIGSVYRLQGNYAHALEVLLKGKSIIVSHELHSENVGLFLALALVHRNIGNYDESMEYLVKCRELRRDAADSMGVAVTTMNIGALQSRMKQYRAALKSMASSLRVFRRARQISREANAWNGLGSVYARQGKNDQALRCYSTALATIRSKNDSYYECAIHVNLAKLYNSKQQFSEAIRYGLRGLKQARECGDVRLEIECLSDLTEYYRSVADYKSALEYSHMAAQKQRVLFDPRNIGAAVKTSLKGEVSGMEKSIEQSTEQLQHLEERIQKKEQELSELVLLIIQKNELLTKAVDSLTRLVGSKRNRSNELATKINDHLTKHSSQDGMVVQLQNSYVDVYSHITQHYPGLSPAEGKVCTLIRFGLTSKEIAELLSLSIRTVETHRRRARKKLGISSGGNSLAQFIAGV